MQRNTLLISFAFVVTVVFSACGSGAAEPTAVPPTATPKPTPYPQISIITASPNQDFDGFIKQLPEADAICLIETIGVERMSELAAGADLEASERERLGGCFSNELVAGFLAGQIQASLGVFSGSSSACLASLLDDIPAGTLSELMIGTEEPQSESMKRAVAGFRGCLTRAELAAFGGLDNDDSAAGSGGSTTEYASRDEECLAGELGESFARGYGGSLNGESIQGFASAIAICEISFSFDNLIVSLEDTERKYTISDLTDVGFKKSKTYDIKGLEGASSAHYGFYGKDSYNRLEYEVRFYFTHAAALEIGVEFASEASGAGASLYSDDQRWQEGLNQRRRCDSSGGHDIGRCGYPKYFDYVVAGNMVLLCEGRDTLSSLQACADLMGVVQ